MARILVIDDQPFVRDVLGKLLESAGHEQEGQGGVAGGGEGVPAHDEPSSGGAVGV